MELYFRNNNFSLDGKKMIDINGECIVDRAFVKCDVVDILI